jgi:electron transport complex protein RnfC
MKEKTKKKSIQSIEDAPFLYVPISQYLGEIPAPTVKPGDTVCKYQQIAVSEKGLSSNVHSPVSGKVLEIKEVEFPDGTSTPCIVIQNDFQETTEKRPYFNTDTLSPEQLLNIIRMDGIVGEGGAQFPTAVKYTLDGHKIDTFIVNGTECEPYLTSDYALMAERTQELVEGIGFVNRILNAENIIISIEEQNKELQKAFAPYLSQLEYSSVRIAILPNQYPQGGELQLIKSVTGIELQRFQRPREAGIIVSNIGTIHAIYEAVKNRRPLISRIITISGEEATHYGNYEVKIGTPIEHITKTLGLDSNNIRVVLGGPMMGKAINDPSVPITKGSAGVLFLKKETIKRSNCISCGYCVDVCPMHLMPMKFEENYRKGKYFNL